MKKNEGNLDRIIRVILAVVLGYLYFTGITTGVPGIILLAVGVILLLTALIGICPLYMLFNLSTDKK
ncbi:MAG TPA: DUF2892 domain-containing protein [Anaerovoracaceae bacterium]|nr:DUF2892 domain-containing protein [Anaerovoracaceae bacterium]